MLSFAIAACSSEHSVTEAGNGTVLRATPLMMQTAVDPMVQPSILIEAGYAPAAQASDLELLSYDDKSPVMGMARPSSSPFGPSFEFVPDAPLVEGWYRFRFVAWGRVDGQRYVYPPTLSRAKSGLDMYESYFHVGSSPLVLSVETCGSTDSRSAFVITFSEPVTAVSDIPIAVKADGHTLSCKLGTEFTGPNGVAIDCDKVSPEAAFNVSFSEGMTAVASGMPVHDVKGDTSFTLSLPTTYVHEQCRVWAETAVPQ